MKLRDLLGIVQYSSVGLTRDAAFACGAAPEVWYDDINAIEETDPDLLDLDVCGITTRCDGDEPEIEIGLYWNGLEEE